MLHNIINRMWYNHVMYTYVTFGEKMTDGSTRPYTVLNKYMKNKAPPPTWYFVYPKKEFVVDKCSPGAKLIIIVFESLNIHNI